MSGHERGKAAARGIPAAAQGIKAAWAGGTPNARSAPADPRTQKNRQAAQTQPTSKKIPSYHHLFSWGSFQNCLKSYIIHLLEGETVRQSPEPLGIPQQSTLTTVFAPYILLGLCCLQYKCEVQLP